MTPTTRKLVIALCASLALNLFGVGFWAARALHRPHPPHAGEQFAARRTLGDLRALGPHAAELIAARRDAMRSHRRALREAQAAVATALVAEPFDRDALQAALATLRARQAAAAETAHSALVELASKLDASGRRALAERGRHMHDR